MNVVCKYCYCKENNSGIYVCWWVESVRCCEFGVFVMSWCLCNRHDGWIIMYFGIQSQKYLVFYN